MIFCRNRFKFFLFIYLTSSARAGDGVVVGRVGGVKTGFMYCVQQWKYFFSQKQDFLALEITYFWIVEITLHQAVAAVAAAVPTEVAAAVPAIKFFSFCIQQNKLERRAIGLQSRPEKMTSKFVKFAVILKINFNIIKIIHLNFQISIYSKQQFLYFIYQYGFPIYLN